MTDGNRDLCGARFRRLSDGEWVICMREPHDPDKLCHYWERPPSEPDTARTGDTAEILAAR
jgi:hypothetical protein